MQKVAVIMLVANSLTTPNHARASTSPIWTCNSTTSPISNGFLFLFGKTGEQNAQCDFATMAKDSFELRFGLAPSLHLYQKATKLAPESYGSLKWCLQLYTSMRQILEVLNFSVKTDFLMSVTSTDDESRRVVPEFVFCGNGKQSDSHNALFRCPFDENFTDGTFSAIIV